MINGRRKCLENKARPYTVASFFEKQDLNFAIVLQALNGLYRSPRCQIQAFVSFLEIFKIKSGNHYTWGAE